MISRACLNSIVAAILLAGPSAATHAADPDPLFADDSIIDVRLSGPFKQIMKERPDEEELKGNFEYIAADGRPVSLEVNIRTRGNYRRRTEVCPFAPLRLNFKKKDLDETIFDKQDKLKLVTHCDNGSRAYKQSIHKEYLAYRILNVMTPMSFRVRLLRITYVYTDDNNDEELTYAFLIESKDRLAKRINMEEQEVNAMSVTLLQPEYTNMTSVFQFLIGNLDFSPVMGATGEQCCHNHTLFSADKKVYWSIPYDFDLAGFVEAPHAKPNPKYRQRSVRQRFYRGRCFNTELLPATLQQFRDKRADIGAVVTGHTEMEAGRRKSLESYIEDFYKQIEKDGAADKLTKACI